MVLGLCGVLESMCRHARVWDSVASSLQLAVWLSSASPPWFTCYASKRKRRIASSSTVEVTWSFPFTKRKLRETTEGQSWDQERSPKCKTKWICCCCWGEKRVGSPDMTTPGSRAIWETQRSSSLVALGLPRMLLYSTTFEVIYICKKTYNLRLRTDIIPSH